MELSVILGWPVLITAVFSIICAILKFNHRQRSKDKCYLKKDWNFYLKKWWALQCIREWKKTRKENIKFTWETEAPQKLDNDTSDNITFFGSNSKNASLYISFTKRSSKISDLILNLTLEDGTFYQLSNDNNNVNCVSYSNDSWKVGDLSLTVLEEFRRWRIVYNGLLSTTNKNGDVEWKHIRFNFIWIYASPPLRVPGDCSDSLLAESVAAKPWKNPYWLCDVTEIQKKGFDQYGCFIGFIILDEDLGQQSTVLHGLRVRRWRPDSFLLHKYVSLYGTTSDGTVYNLEIEIKRNHTQMKYGNIRLPNGKIASIESMDLDTELLCYSSEVPKAFTIKLSTKDRNFVVFITVNKKGSKQYEGSHPEQWKCEMVPYQMGINGYQGSGYLQIWQPIGGNSFIKPDLFNKHLSWLPSESIDEKIPLCATFKEKVSSCPAFVGGKAASLSLLSSLDSDVFSVPNGFCLTSRALESQINHNKHLAEAIKNIESVVVDYEISNMKECCQRVTQLFEKTPVCDIVRELISCHFEDLKEKESQKQHNKSYFAVRSSGIGEDSDELSAAGQNATILGCKSLPEVLNGVQKCWASLFTFQSVEYRRQHSQVVNCGMGVVIQTMVEADVAGVMFTRHPNNGDPRQLFITSSYGLGESVVSGHVEPDTIIVDVNGDSLAIKNYTVGRKEQQIMIDHSENNQTLSLSTNIDEAKKKSLTDEECLALAALGLQQEKLWGSPRDIEWAISKGKIYLLQARPITTLNYWSEFELLHEFDTAIMSDEDIMIFSNTGEVMPGAFSILGQTLIVDTLDRAISYQVRYNDAHHEIIPFSLMTMTHHHAGLNFLNSILIKPEKEVSIRSKTLDIAIAGHIITNEKNISVAIHRNGIYKLSPLKSIFHYTGCIWNSQKKSEMCTEMSKKYKIDLTKCSSSLEMYEEIAKNINLLHDTALCHTLMSSASVFSQIIFLTTLLGTKTDFTMENYQDIATILSSCTDTVSAEIPQMLKKIALALDESGKMELFKEQTPEGALNWLKNSIPNVHSMLTTFLEKHGHRSIKEFDLMTDTWSMDPTPLIETLQRSQGLPVKETNRAVSINELISKLTTPIDGTTRKVLKFVIPLCQKLVNRREATKDANIFVIHKMRLAFRKLEKQMIKEWRIPEEKLIYMLSFLELGRLLRTRDPGLVTKAKLRKRYFKKWNDLRFHEINWGFPQPITEDINKNHISNGSGGVVITGTPVCSGDVVGRACVINDISKINELQNGDILITHSTDIGWSPYFPMLLGVVTELGGLISHGAVVAREYGLPCIVGAEGASSAFKTGDQVFLSAGRGTLQKT